MATRISIVSEDESTPSLEQEQGTSVESYASFIANQAKEIFHKDQSLRRRHDTHFYTIVLGGNTRAVQNVVEYMETNGMKDVLDWLLNRTDKKSDENKSSSITVKHRVVFFLLILFNFLFTPVFYVVHKMTHYLLNKRQKRISKNTPLPLVFAVCSQKKDMWTYFLSLGACVTDCDIKRNNIFHYIADLSAESPDQAVTIFKKLIEFMNDMDSVKTLVLDQTNAEGLSALEYAVKYGGPSLITEILQFPDLLRHTILTVKDDTLTVDEKGVPSEGKANLPDTRVDYVDVSRYECGELEHRSSILNLLSDRNLMMMSRDDLKIFQRSLLVGKWISMKVKQMKMLVLSLHVHDFVLTVYLLFASTLHTHPNKMLFERWIMGTQTVLLREVQSLEQNMSYVFKSEAYPRVLDNVRHDYQVKILNLLDRNMTSLFGKTAVAYPEFRTEWMLEYERKNFTDPDNFPHSLLDAIAETALSMNEYQDFWPQFYVSLHLRDILVLYSQNASYFDDHNLQSGIDLYSESFYQLRIVDTNLSFVVNTAVPYTDFINFMCVKEMFFNRSDLNASTTGINQMSDLDACVAKSHLDIASDLAANCTCSNNSLAAMYEKVEGTYLEYATGDMVKVILKLLLFVCLSYILFDLFERCCFVYLSIAGKSNTSQMIMSVLGTKVPGSYLKKQVNNWSVWLFFSFGLMDTFSTKTEVTTETKWVYLMTLSLVLRFLMHIHSVRLSPEIGHFVITTFMMGNNLLHFSVVFVIVVAIFSLIFSLILTNPQCSIENLAGFHTLLDSMFSTFRLTFGHGDIDSFYSNFTAKASYVMYIVIMGLLLMNLIIGVMSSTATDVMQEPWRKTIWHMEWLEEALSAEYTVSVLRHLLCCNDANTDYAAHSKLGFIVDRGDDGKFKMYIPVRKLPMIIHLG